MNLEEVKETFIKYPKIYRYDSRYCRNLFEGDIRVSVKEDGSNFRFWFNGEDFIFGTRELFVFKGECWKIVHEELEPRKIDAKYARLADKIQLMAIETPTNWIVFGEYVGGKNKHTIKYPGLADEVRVFDIWDINKHKFLNPIVWVDYMKELGFQVVMMWPLGTDYTSASQFTVVENQEGIVIKNYGNGVFGKMVNKEYHKKRQSNLNSGKDKLKYESKLLDECVTKNRLMDIIRKLQDGKEFEWNVTMMPRLITEMYYDIIMEELSDFVLDNKKMATFNFNAFKGRIGKAVFEVFDVLMKENFEANKNEM